MMLPSLTVTATLAVAVTCSTTGMLAFTFTVEPFDKEEIGHEEVGDTQIGNAGGGGGGGGGGGWGTVAEKLKKVKIEKLPARAVTVIVYPPARAAEAKKVTLPSAVN